jgi:hypothetical protein
MQLVGVPATYIRVQHNTDPAAKKGLGTNNMRMWYARSYSEERIPMSNIYRTTTPCMQDPHKPVFLNLLQESMLDCRNDELLKDNNAFQLPPLANWTL